MAVEVMSWLFAIPLLGICTGLRSLTPMAVICWFAWLGYLPVDGTWAAWTGRLWVAIVFTVLALGELVADKLPKTPNRTSTGPLLARLVLGGLGGSICATALNGSGLEGVLLSVRGIHDPARRGGEAGLPGLADRGRRGRSGDPVRSVRAARDNGLGSGYQAADVGGRGAYRFLANSLPTLNKLRSLLGRVAPVGRRRVRRFGHATDDD